MIGSALVPQISSNRFALHPSITPRNWFNISIVVVSCCIVHLYPYHAYNPVISPYTISRIYLYSTSYKKQSQELRSYKQFSAIPELCYTEFYKTPLVLGMSFPPVLEMASRIANASALKADSALYARDRAIRYMVLEFQ